MTSLLASSVVNSGASFLTGANTISVGLVCYSVDRRSFDNPFGSVTQSIFSALDIAAVLLSVGAAIGKSTRLAENGIAETASENAGQAEINAGVIKSAEAQAAAREAAADRAEAAAAEAAKKAKEPIPMRVKGKRPQAKAAPSVPDEQQGIKVKSYYHPAEIDITPEEINYLREQESMHRYYYEKGLRSEPKPKPKPRIPSSPLEDTPPRILDIAISKREPFTRLEPPNVTWELSRRSSWKSSSSSSSEGL
ncbi:hypothetical protein Barb4_05440 [Bacteroidales bacterium Barb4]|nr:hypothetical protein Barb4_05440 [Bacteroidales bacterium Barb4]